MVEVTGEVRVVMRIGIWEFKKGTFDVTKSQVSSRCLGVDF